MSGNIRFDKLDKNNYDTWKLQMKSMLVKDGLWDYVNGTARLPEETTTNLEEITNWHKNDEKALADIMLSVSASELLHIKKEKTSREAWLKLESIYQSRAPARKALLMQNIILMKMKEDDDPRAYLSEYFDNVDKLNEVDITINDELLSILLLHSLPPTFETFKRAIMTRDEILKPEVLRLKIIEDSDSNKRSRSNQDSDSNALFVNNVPKHRNVNKRQGNRQYRSSSQMSDGSKRSHESEQDKRKKIKCFRCQKVGHIAKDCHVNLSNIHKNQNSENGNYGNLVSDGEIALFNDYGMNKSANKIWCLDSGCSSHMISDKSLIQNFTSIDKSLNLANNKTTKIKGVGEVKIEVKNKNELKKVKLNKVYFVSDLRTNLLSVSKMTSKNYEVLFRKDDALILDEKQQPVMRAIREGDLYYIKDEHEECKISQESNAWKPRNEMEMWHCRLGHINEQALKQMIIENKVHGMNVKNIEKLPSCEICAMEKSTRLPYKKITEKRTTDVLEVIHSDVWGPSRQSSISGCRYYVTFIDDYSRWCEITFMKNKSGVLEAFKNYKAKVERQTGRKIKYLQSDNGREYVNHEFDNFLKKEGIQRRLTAPHTPQQNGVAERLNRTLIEMAKCLLKQGNMELRFWAEAVNTAVYIRNRCSSKSINGQIPYTIWTGKVPSLFYFRNFGCKAYVIDKMKPGGKWSSNAKYCILLGYSNTSKAYRLWLPEKQKLIISRDVKFLDEPGMTENIGEYRIQNESIKNNEYDKIIEIDNNKQKLDNTPCQSNNNNMVNHREIRGRGRPKIIRDGRRGRPRKLYNTLVADINRENIVEDEISDNNDDEIISMDDEVSTNNENEIFTNLITMDAPEKWEDVESGEESDEWLAALESEYLALIKNQTWQIVKRPKDRKVIGNRLVLQQKSDGKVTKKKVRLVAKGCAQKFGEDYIETYSPVVKTTSIRLLSALSAKLNLIIHQMDVETAYLHSELDEAVYMEIPVHLNKMLNKIIKSEPIGILGEIIKDGNIINTAKKWLKSIEIENDAVCLLRRALYGLKQSGAQWYKTLSNKLMELNLKPFNQDRCFFHKQENDNVLLLAVYVDDLLIASNNEDWIKEVKNFLVNSFPMKDLGVIKTCLGIEFEQDIKKNEIRLVQQKYINKLLNRFGMSDCKTVNTPIEVKCDLIMERDGKEKDERFPYQQLIGGLLYLAISTRPDITYAVNYLSQFNNCYQEVHWKAAKRVLRYLKGTSNYGLKYVKTNEKLTIMVDADWGGNMIDRRSYTGYVCMFGGAPISWEAKKQKTVALSSTEAEYMAMAEAAREFTYLSSFLTEMNIDCEDTIMLNDSQSAQNAIYSNAIKSRSKHIDVRHHYIRDIVEKGLIRIKYVPTDEMPADVLTKGLSGPKHNNCLKRLGINMMN